MTTYYMPGERVVLSNGRKGFVVAACWADRREREHQILAVTVGDPTRVTVGDPTQDGRICDVVSVSSTTVSRANA